MGYDRGDSFPFVLNEMEFQLVRNRKENCHHDQIPFKLKGNVNIVLSVEPRPNFAAVEWFFLAKLGVGVALCWSSFVVLKFPNFLFRFLEICSYLCLH